MRKKIISCILIPISLVFSSCSDQPSQVSNQGQILPNPTSPSVALKDAVDVFSEGEEDDSKVYIPDHVYGRSPTEFRVPRVTGNLLDDKIEQNGKKPLIFDGSNPSQSSFAGVTFNMSYAEASEILSPPIVGACGSLGDYYRENLCLLWTPDEPRRLRQAYILGGYLGHFDFPQPIGKQPPGAELNQFFNDELGLDLVVKTYNKFFNKVEEEENYNCIDEQTCQVLKYNQYINWILPNMTLIFSKDRKVFVGMIINRDVTAKVAPLDVLRGEMRFSDEVSVTLGQTWSEVKNILNSKEEPPAIVETATYRKDYVGMVLRTERAGIYEGADVFDVNQVKPKGSEIINEIVVYSDYKEPIMINGKYVKIDLDGQDNLHVSLSSERPSNNEMFSVRMDKFAKKIELQKSLLMQLKDLIAKEVVKISSLDNSTFDSTFGGGRYSRKIQRLFGLNARQAPNRRMSLQIDMYNPSTGQSITSIISIGYNSGGMVFKTIARRSPFEGIIFESTEKPVDFHSPKLAGFALGQEVTLKSIDRIKNEAFLEIDGKTTRVKINLYASDKVSYLENESVYTLQENIRVVSGLSGVKMALAPTHSIAQDTTQIEAEIIYLASGRNTFPIDNICQAQRDSSFIPKFGMSQREFLKGMRKKLQTKAWSCSPFVEPDDDGDREASSVYFPNQKMGQKVFFSGRIVSGVVKYKKPGVQLQMGGQ